MRLPISFARPISKLLVALILIAGSTSCADAFCCLQESAASTPKNAGTSTTEHPAATANAAPTQTDFARDVFPILQEHCIKCHGSEKQEGDLRVDQSEILLSEDFVSPGDAANSRMYEVLISDEDDRMPPAEEGAPLATNKIVAIKSWIDEGAKWADISALLVADSKPNQGGPSDVSVPLSPRAEYWRNVWRAFGDLHPATVHFPIALLVIGGVFALFGLGGSYRCSDFAFYCLWMGAISAVLASFLGWSFAWNEGHNEDPFIFDQNAELFWHRWTGVLLSILAFLIAVWATLARRRNPDDGTMWKLCMVVLAGLTIYVGHAGGDLTHRRGYKRLYELIGIQSAEKPATEVTPGAKALDGSSK